MKIINLMLAGSGLAMLMSCGEAKQETPKEEVSQWKVENDSTVLEWTAYKTSDKVPVGGTFTSYKLASSPADSPEELLRSLSIEIEVASVETKDAGRNEKIVKHFFGTLASERINGQVKTLADDGTAVIGLSLNGIEVELPVKYTLEGDWFSFSTSVDVSIWNAMNGIENLNEVCYDLHKGKDGVSKLWSEVTLSFKTKLTRTKSE